MYIREITDQDVNEEMFDVKEWSTRNAVRMLLFDQAGRIALMFVARDGYYKLPGGGIEGSESHEEALKREIEEETGATFGLIELFGSCTEFMSKTAMHQVSTIYTGEVVRHGQPVLTSDEEAAGFTLEWRTPEEALRLLETKRSPGYFDRFIATRDTEIVRSFLSR
ncbi:NUDIX domain-containing protein [Exiguobacterium flavidum]|uniref:NUDIX domain-containing protein n=1 Tax=Exiguobacterium flavidum TaxID=2184695 RepID=UPI0013006296|nr:NUDIX domain-containing protein [Exiguobacterium flavidum]